MKIVNVLTLPVLTSFLLLIVTIFNANSTAAAALPENISEHIINSKAQSIDLQFDANVSSQKHLQLRQWVTHAGNALLQVYGEFPVDHFITKIKASKRSSGAVPWGEVNRYSTPEVTLVINPKSSLEDLKADWTIYHEFSHLLIPYDAGDARWFSEGLASYYQNVIQARAGMLDERMMWQKLFDGLERGRKQTQYSHQKLAYLSDNIASNRQYMRIYWSGALYWLKADIALRKLAQSSTSPVNKTKALTAITSLDSALRQLRACCFNQYLSAEQLIAKLDKISQSQIFTRLFKEFSSSYAMPNYQALLLSLGVRTENNSITLTGSAPLATHRMAIYKSLAGVPR
jgi:hypothetical protein